MSTITFNNDNIVMVISYTDDYGFPAKTTVNSNSVAKLENYNNTITIKTIDESTIPKISYINKDGETIEYVPTSNEFSFNIYTSYGENYDYIIIIGENTDDMSISGLTHIYRVDYDILKEVANIRYSISNVDLGNYIINIVELPFNFNEVIAGNNPIILGDNITKITADELKTDVLNIDLGNIEVKGKFKNSYDYVNTTVLLYLPFVETVELDTGLIIDKTINITYIVNLYTGDTTINIRDVDLNDIIYTKQVVIGRKIPFKNVDYPITNGLDNGILTPFIKVVRKEPIQDRYVANVEQVDILRNVKGYVEVSNIQLETGATLQEKNNILTLLRNGVIIK